MRYFCRFRAFIVAACAGPQVRAPAISAGHRAGQRPGHPWSIRRSASPTPRRRPPRPSHASAVYSRDGRYAFRLRPRRRADQGRFAGRPHRQTRHSGRQRHRRFDFRTAASFGPELHARRHHGLRRRDLELLAEVPAEYAPASSPRWWAWPDAGGNQFAYALFDGGEIWVSDFSVLAARSPDAFRRQPPTMAW